MDVNVIKWVLTFKHSFILVNKFVCEICLLVTQQNTEDYQIKFIIDILNERKV